MRNANKVLAGVGIAAVAILLTAYIVGYFSAGKRIDWPAATALERPKIERSYPRLWIMMTYHPAGRIESWLRGTRVDITCSHPNL
jgi:hypothetical protein